MSDLHEDLLRAGTGDREAQSRICLRYVSALNRRISRMLTPDLRRRYDTSDLAQSVIYQALLKLAEFEYRGEAAFFRWLTVLAENKVRMKRRRQVDACGRRRERTSHGEVAAGREPPPLDAAIRQEEAREARDLLDRLEARTRAIVELRCWEDLTFAEISECLELPSAPAARMAFARALTRLRSEEEAAALQEALARMEAGWTPDEQALSEAYPNTHVAIRRALSLQASLRRLPAE